MNILSKIWCCLRSHPYPIIYPENDPDEPLILREPPYCSNCGKEFYPSRGMHS